MRDYREELWPTTVTFRPVTIHARVSESRTFQRPCYFLPLQHIDLSTLINQAIMSWAVNGLWIFIRGKFHDKTGSYSLCFLFIQRVSSHATRFNSLQRLDMIYETFITREMYTSYIRGDRSVVTDLDGWAVLDLFCSRAQYGSRVLKTIRAKSFNEMF